MERRSFLGLTAGGVAALAGCPGNSNSGDGGSGGATPTETETATPGPADISASLSVGGNVTVGEPSTIRLTVENTGGRPGSFEGTLAVTEGNSEFSETVQVDAVPPGDSIQRDVSVTFETGDDYTVALESPELTGTQTATVRAAPKQFDVGERISLTDDLAATVTDVRLTEMVRYKESRNSEYGLFSSTRETTGVLAAPTGKTLAVLEFELENTGTSTVTFDHSQFALPGGEFYTSLTDELQQDGVPLTDRVNLDPSQVQAGYLLAQVETEALRDGGLTLDYQADAAQTPPEKRLVHQPETVPQSNLELVSLRGPSEMAVGEQYQVTAVVRNTGETAGTLEGVFQWKYEGASDYDDPEWMADTLADPKTPTVTVPAGEAKEITITTSSEGDGTFKYRLAPLTGETLTTTFD